MDQRVIETVRERKPLIHCITNYVTVVDVANMLLSCGGAPIMADDIREAEEITSICGGLNINIGTLNERTVQSMFAAGKKANELNHFTILDPVGAGASSLRTRTTFRLLDEVKFSVIRGNISEIKTIANGRGTTQGVDADIKDAITEDNLFAAVDFVKKLSKKTDSIIAVTGAIDLVSDQDTTYVIRNGHPMMSHITGSGCMLTAVIAAYGTANPNCLLEATAAAVCAVGLSGEIAREKIREIHGGNGSFKAFFMDVMSQMNDEKLKEGALFEIR
ncbi:hydroxyethylthiazole kinase [Sinanaerobacter sp. ZZT-01]|uniref:hydroxyethylthiazole kinase n=1 Tax=Sinanaerobacter sp. ZZT-01 TaxID=3111540 RepID=UPI002D78A5A0|nr:hydroxyethylthiazole kinase [Sinanaerobacter sp. ZZT-01]WRR93100.1 hydroxyethylthiazole kinase [Sinanaerobacter sp. ZZT-01]